MNNVFKLTVILFYTTFCFSQTEENPDKNFPQSLMIRLFENLNHGSDKFDKYPVLQEKNLYSIMGCIYLLESKEQEIEKIAIARLKGIATQLFNEGKPVKLTFGMDSGYLTKKENENLNDDNNIIYLNIAECIVRKSELTAQKAFNDQTRQLIDKKNGG